ncbi:hypothetical protein [Streptomyces sp. NPDC059272]|uniref:hypothetical protein n=1 Tax=Streptomyces sp. NPDC059272 TaxID=3346800 RepID=UPI003673B5F0
MNVPPSVAAGIVVHDRQTGTFAEQSNAHTQFRSASAVKLLIALDDLWDRDPGCGLPSDDRARLDSLLRSSDEDSAADFYWTEDGGSAIIYRMIPRLRLTDTVGPPADYPGHLGLYGPVCGRRHADLPLGPGQRTCRPAEYRHG